MEALRKSEKVSGYEWWLLQDFWMGSNGIVDAYFVPKHPADELDKIAILNNAILLMVAEPSDALPIPASSPRLLVSYTSKQTLKTSVHVSNQEITDIEGAKLSWQLIGIDADGVRSTICNRTVAVGKIAQTPGATEIASVECVLPDLGVFWGKPQLPLTLSLEATLVDKDDKQLATNQWRSRLFAALSDGPSASGHQVYAVEKFCERIPVNNMICNIPPAATKLPLGSVVVVDYIDGDVLAHAAGGATVLLLGNSGTGFLTDPASYKTAWWLGSETDNNMGTVVYNSSRPFTHGMSPEGWADHGWYNLIQGGFNFVLEGSLHKNVEMLIRSIDLMGAAIGASSLQDNPYIPRARNKALMWQTGILPKSGDTSGVLIASGLNLATDDISKQKPEAAWLLYQLLQYAFSAPKPSKFMRVKLTECSGCLPPMTWTLCPDITEEVEVLI